MIRAADPLRGGRHAGRGLPALLHRSGRSAAPWLAVTQTVKAPVTLTRESLPGTGRGDRREAAVGGVHVAPNPTRLPLASPSAATLPVPGRDQRGRRYVPFGMGCDEFETRLPPGACRHRDPRPVRPEGRRAGRHDCRARRCRPRHGDGAEGPGRGLARRRPRCLRDRPSRHVAARRRPVGRFHRHRAGAVACGVGAAREWRSRGATLWRS